MGWKTLRGNRPLALFRLSYVLSYHFPNLFNVHCDKAVSLVQRLSCLSHALSGLRVLSLLYCTKFCETASKVISNSDWMMVIGTYGSDALRQSWVSFLRGVEATKMSEFSKRCWSYKDGWVFYEVLKPQNAHMFVRKCLNYVFLFGNGNWRVLEMMHQTVWDSIHCG